VEAEVPLSEEELRLLEQMERALSEEDPKFASTLRGTTLRRTARRRAVAAGVLLVAGVAILMTGVVTKIYALGVVGFVVMLGATTWGVNALRSHQGSPASPEHPSSRPAHGGFTVIDGGRSGRRGGGRPRRSGTFMERVELRWRRRRESGGF
jgi:hypothetical protein